MNIAELSDQQYALLFDVRRSIRYHDRRRAFFERLHQLTGGLTVLLAGSVLFDLARPGDTPPWLSALAATSAVLAAWDMVIGYASKVVAHRELRQRFGRLEMDILSGGSDAETWNNHRRTRLSIEQDEPPIYRALDALCHNELLRAEGVRDEAHKAKVNGWQKLTRHIFHWADLAT